jgi:hypothetical protein
LSALLIVGAPTDPHIAKVVDLVAARGGEALVIDLSDPSATARLSYGVAVPSGAGAVGANRPFDDVISVWWRPKPTLEQLRRPSFRNREWQFALEALEALTPHARWVNPRHVDLRCRHKPGQLIAAQQAGLETPPTLISNDHRVVHDFLAPLCETAAYKTLSWFGSEPGHALFTQCIPVARLADYAANIAAAPGIFQPYIEKAFEIRATVVGAQIFAVEIRSQESEDTRTDWRRNPSVAPHVRTELPADVAERLLAFHAGQGLVLGAYDFIVTPEGRYVFLEVNSLGQWLWLEAVADAPISEALADILLGGSAT